MKQEDMVVGREYVNELNDGRYFFTGYRNPLEGNFRNFHFEYVFPYFNMTEAKPEFDIDDEIEVCIDNGFVSAVFKGKFKYFDPDGEYWIARDIEGHMVHAKFARKVEPMVTVYFDDLSGMMVKDCLIPKSLADKIKAGDYS